MTFAHPHDIIDFCNDLFLGIKHMRGDDTVLCDDASYFFFGVSYARILLQQAPGSSIPKDTFEMFYEKYREYNNQAFRGGMALGKHLFCSSAPFSESYPNL